MEAIDASLGSGDATARAQELRASLGARQEAEALLAEAGRLRQDAVSAADAVVAEAQQLSELLVAESRRTAEQITGEARERADAIRSAAESEIEEHRRRVRAEITDQVTRDLTERHRLAEERAHERSDALISDLEASVRILGVSLESALANISELLGSLEGLRSTAGPGADELTAGAEPLAATSYGHDRPDGPATGVPSAASPFGTQLAAASGEPPDLATSELGSARPRSATEAFLTSSGLEVEKGTRELQDLQHPEQARRRRGDESRRAAQLRELEVGIPEDEIEADSNGSRPLGWLFRTAQ